MNCQTEIVAKPTPHLTQKDKVLLVKGVAGLGNRILCLLSAVLFARITSRKLVIDWSDSTYSDDGKDIFPYFFTVPAICSIDKVCLSSKSVSPRIWENRLYTHYHALKKELFPEKNLYSPKLTKLFSVKVSHKEHLEEIIVMLSLAEQIQQIRTHFQGEYSYLKYQSNREILSSLAGDYLRPHLFINNEIKSFTSSHLTGETVGVHIRHTDKRCRIEAIYKRLKQLNKQCRDIKIFLATDNQDVEIGLKQQYGSQVIALEKWYPDNGQALHLSSGCPNRLDSGRHALTEIYLLASCKYLIYDENSSFGYVASLISNTPGSHQYNVSPTRFFPRWIRHELWNLRYELLIKYLKS